MEENVDAEVSAPNSQKLCFVTIGATASFDNLLRAVLQPSFLQTLQDAEYTDLRIQYGTEGRPIFDDFVSRNENAIKDRFKIRLTGFDFDKNGLNAEMRAVKGNGLRAPERGAAVEGAVISHAG